MGWLSDAGSWVSKQTTAVKDFAVKSVVDTAAEVADFADDAGDYIADTAVEFKDDMVQVAKDAADNSKGILKGAALGVGFIPVVGDAAEILLHGAAAGVGIMQNPNNWKGELAEFGMEAAIAAIPGPNVVGIAKFAGKAGVAAGKEVVQRGSVVVAKEISEVAVKSTVKTAKNLGEKAVENGVTKTSVEQFLMPGVGSWVTKSVKDGVTVVAGKEVAQAAVKNLDAPINVLQKAFRDVKLPSVPGWDNAVAKYTEFALKNKWKVGTVKSAMDEVYENIFLEPLGQAYGSMEADRLASDGELVTTMMGDEYRGVNNNVLKAMADHGIVFPEDTKQGHIDATPIEQYLEQLSDKATPEIYATLAELTAERGQEFASLDEDTKQAYFEAFFRHVAESRIEDDRVNGFDYELPEGGVVKQYVVAWDFDKQVPVTSENLDDYKHLMKASSGEGKSKSDDIAPEKEEVGEISPVQIPQNNAGKGVSNNL